MIIETEEWMFQLADAVPFPTNEKLREHACNLRWMTFEEIGESIAENSDCVPDDINVRVRNAIQKIKQSNAGGLVVGEKTFAGGVVKYKIKAVKNIEATKARAITVTTELAPIMEEIHQALQHRNSQDVVGLVKPQIKRLDSVLKRYS